MQTLLILLLKLLLIASKVYLGVIAVYCLLTWLPDGIQSGLGQFVARITEPFLNVFDRLIPGLAGISFSPIIAGFFIYLVQRGLITIINLIVMGV